MSLDEIVTKVAYGQISRFTFKEMLAFFLNNKVISIDGHGESDMWPSSMTVNGNEYTFSVTVGRELQEDRTWWVRQGSVSVVFQMSDDDLAIIRAALN